MSDRRSFSEIRADVLREHGVDAGVERVWKRLESNLTKHERAKRKTSAAWILVSASTFALGVIVGARFEAPAAVLIASPVAEPVSVVPRPAGALVESTAAQQTTHALRRIRPLHHAPIAPARRSDPNPATTADPIEPPKPQRSTEWQHLAEEGEYVQALASLESNGGFDAALASATADDLMSLVDVARATGQRERAILALRRIVDEHGADPNAPVAAWMLGNELFKAHDLVGADQAFAKYRALSPDGDFAEDALARRIDMAFTQGNVDRARALGDQYFKEFPDGPRTADIQASLARIASEAPTSSAAPAPAPAPSDVAPSDVAPGDLDAGLLP